MSTAVVVIPTYNEAENIEAVLDQVRLAAPGVHVLVVDDDSPDGTARLVEAHPAYLRDVFLLRHGRKAGLGAAYRVGFSWALGHHYDVVVQMDADLSHPPAQVPALIDALGSTDVAIGSRYVPGGGVAGWPWTRRLVSWAGNLYVRLVLELPVRDVTAGFKAFRAPALVAIEATGSASNGYCFQIESTWRAVGMGLRVAEVPITFTDRTAGTSKMSGAIAVEALRRVLVWRWQARPGGRRAARGRSPSRVPFATYRRSQAAR